ncbi:hypothetical protein EDC19_1705 [Natranaerovirga hydrolytica]|uniref:HNH endonuclease n=1 Tax=Natranaerovirga hydrolytica TaxID=680378 RepID=A0A4V2Q067_9FIRM|nr:hypothetical protein [Natranaerovirga hydrolytica]TCK92561.1 hypothetical protein EDC19_1705 [Natranaerovirga hydrolytica]
MWYFYNEFENEELESLINQINSVFTNIFSAVVFEYPNWMSRIKLKSDFEEFKGKFELSQPEEKEKLADAFSKNIQVENVCNMTVDPVSYEDLLNGSSEEFVRCISALKTIQGYLYDNLLKLKGLVEEVGTLKNYYEKFYDESIEYVCPFCGIGPMLTSKDQFREAFDHYLPRSKYPFVSLLRKNLFPICHTCNSTYKGDKNPRDHGKVFYPFMRDDNDCEPVFTIRTGVIENLEIASQHFQGEIETWNEVFAIKDRIKNFAEVNLSGWMSNVSEAVGIYNIDLETAKNAEIERCKSNKMQDHKFIKKAVLEAL